jgi:hypothetical protein
MRKGSVIGILILASLIGGHFIALHSQIHRVNQFCAAMRPGLDIRRISDIAT